MDWGYSNFDIFTHSADEVPRAIERLVACHVTKQVAKGREHRLDKTAPILKLVIVLQP
jgi:hypothetical protein